MKNLLFVGLMCSVFRVFRRDDYFSAGMAVLGKRPGGSESGCDGTGIFRRLHKPERSFDGQGPGFI